MSIHKVKDDDGKITAYQVRWREGSRNRQKTYTRAKHRDAATRAANWQREVDSRKAQGLPTLDTRVTVDKLADRWERVHVSGLRPASQTFYKRHLRKRIRPLLGHLPVARIDRSQIAEFVAAMRKTKPPTSAAGINDTLDTLRALMSAAVEWDVVPVNHVLKVRRPKQEKAEVQVYTPADVAKIASSCKHHRDAAMVIVAAFTGLRWGELAALRWSDIHGDYINVVRAIDSETGKVGPTKAHQQRRVPLFAVAARALEGWQASEDWERWPNTKYVFPKKDGDHLLYGSWRENHWDKARVGAGFPHARFHWLRHTFASLIIAHGASALQAKKWMGHSTITLTYDTYGHMFEGDASLVMSKINELTTGL